MATNFILSNGDVEDDVVPPHDDGAVQKSDVVPPHDDGAGRISDVDPGKSDVDTGKNDVYSGKSDVACHVSRVLGGFHFRHMFPWTSRGTSLSFAGHHALTRRCPRRCLRRRVLCLAGGLCGHPHVSEETTLDVAMSVWTSACLESGRCGCPG
jgi:hypothetical protein